MLCQSDVTKPHEVPRLANSSDIKLKLHSFLIFAKGAQKVLMQYIFYHRTSKKSAKLCKEKFLVYTYFLFYIYKFIYFNWRLHIFSKEIRYFQIFNSFAKHIHSINIQPSFPIQYTDNIQIDPFSTFQYHQKLCVMKDLAAL